MWWYLTSQISSKQLSFFPIERAISLEVEGEETSVKILKKIAELEYSTSANSKQQDKIAREYLCLW